MNAPRKKGVACQSSEVCIELVTALHIGSGEASFESDADVIRDYNGLPAIPGTSLQGVLRAAFESYYGVADTGQLTSLFGYAGTAGGQGDKEAGGRGGRLWASWASIHNSFNEPQRGRITLAEVRSDAVLRDAFTPMLRDHVRLTAHGSAADTGKFDELVVSPGHRFTFTLKLMTAAGDPLACDDDWRKLMTLLNGRFVRIGGKTRRGLGAVRVISIDGAKPIEQNTDGSMVSRGSEFVDGAREFTTTLTSQTNWMFGGGLSGQTVSAPVTGAQINWVDSAGGVAGEPQEVWIVPWGSVKGSLRHRTEFHLCRQIGLYIDKPEDAERRADLEEKRDRKLRRLFGSVDKCESCRGHLLGDDLYVPCHKLKPASVQPHVRIDPFTGGAMDHLLFDDQPLRAQEKLPELHISILPDWQKDEETLKAFGEAWADLCNGRLALGAHSGRGYGFFDGQSEGEERAGYAT